jgi:hypothetical protein
MDEQVLGFRGMYSVAWRMTVYVELHVPSNSGDGCSVL